MFDKFKLFIVLKTSAASIILQMTLKPYGSSFHIPRLVGIGDKLLKRLLPCKIEGFHDGV